MDSNKTKSLVFTPKKQILKKKEGIKILRQKGKEKILRCCFKYFRTFHSNSFLEIKSVYLKKLNCFKKSNDSFS
jgi:hypothetical protein